LEVCTTTGKVWERVRFVGLRNFETGQVIVIDTFSVRLGRMKTRIFDWALKVDQWRQSNNSRLVLITLTYKKVGDYRAGHIGDYLRNLKKRLGKNLLAFAWVAELQERGAVHYHLVILVTPGTDIPKPDRKGYWVHGMSKIETARTAFYLATYTGKEYQKDLSKYPKSCRLYAVSIRSSMGIKTAVRSSGGQIAAKYRVSKEFKKNPGFSPSEGGSLWKFGVTGVGERGADFVRFMMDEKIVLGRADVSGD
jgi:hypothetical protein